MVKTKHQKSKPKKHRLNQKPGNPSDISQFRTQIDALGLQIIQVTADGNCFFRVLADQLEGNQEEHTKYRSMVVQYILKNRELFEPFVEDDVPFIEYCESMGKDGTWAGHLEVQAASLVTHSNLCIHRMLSPRWYIQNFDNQEARMIHLSYHNEEHYNSVRLKEDTCDGPAKPIIIKADADSCATSLQSKACANHQSNAGKGVSNPGLIKSVMAGSDYQNAQKVEQVLSEVGGDVDAAVVFLIPDQVTEAYKELIESPLCNANSSEGLDEAENHHEAHMDDVMMLKHDKEKRNRNNGNQSSHEKISQLATKNVPGNKICPCGSKKNKICCGSAAGKSSTSKAAVNRRMDDTKKGRKAGKRGHPKPKSFSMSDGSLPDMGSLCI